MTTFNINPEFEDLQKPETILNHIEDLTKPTAENHSNILSQLLEQFEPLDFQELAFDDAKKIKEKLDEAENGSDEAKELQKRLDKLKVNTKHYLVISVENIIRVAEQNRWGLCKNHDFIYLYNGAYWDEIDKETFQKFLGKAAEKMGVPKFNARYFEFREKLFKQFLATGYLPTPESDINKVQINLLNGTFDITPKEAYLRPFDHSNFLTYQLPFEYDETATAPLFQAYLDKVLPDVERQKVLAEYLGYIFIKHGGRLKLEAALILHGTGANGKSVFFEIVNALLGSENVSSYSLQELTDNSGYYRAMIANKLVNYASEINGKLEADKFKKMVSGEIMPARLPYGKPMELTNYAKFIFNCNELPRDVEHTNAYFRRWLIIPFDVTIPPSEQDKNLHNKIIEKELSGVFNWVLEGLDRLLQQEGFTHCEAAQKAIDAYKKESNSVQMFIEENEYESDSEKHTLIKDLYSEYKAYCIDDGMPPFKKTNFIKQLRALGYVVDKVGSKGNAAYVSKNKENGVPW